MAKVTLVCEGRVHQVDTIDTPYTFCKEIFKFLDGVKTPDESPAFMIVREDMIDRVLRLWDEQSSPVSSDDVKKGSKKGIRGLTVVLV